MFIHIWPNVKSVTDIIYLHSSILFYSSIESSFSPSLYCSYNRSIFQDGQINILLLITYLYSSGTSQQGLIFISTYYTLGTNFLIYQCLNTYTNFEFFLYKCKIIMYDLRIKNENCWYHHNHNNFLQFIRPSFYTYF